MDENATPNREVEMLKAMVSDLSQQVAQAAVDLASVRTSANMRIAQLEAALEASMQGDQS